MLYRPYKLRVVYDAEGHNSETFSFERSACRDAAHEEFKKSPFVLSVESWDELHSVPKLIRNAVER